MTPEVVKKGRSTALTGWMRRSDLYHGWQRGTGPPWCDALSGRGRCKLVRSQTPRQPWPPRDRVPHSEAWRNRSRTLFNLLGLLCVAVPTSIEDSVQMGPAGGRPLQRGRPDCRLQIAAEVRVAGLSPSAECVLLVGSRGGDNRTTSLSSPPG
jgi:hypothetical protein